MGHSANEISSYAVLHFQVLVHEIFIGTRTVHDAQLFDKVQAIRNHGILVTKTSLDNLQERATLIQWKLALLRKAVAALVDHGDPVFQTDAPWSDVGDISGDVQLGIRGLCLFFGRHSLGFYVEAA